ncbi:MAG: hypothetical protein QOH12_2586 [Solirubrobacteraceae bacterium]|jgi:hypothetical protein|nr:hypothetical protein [Solirubrobacteraceae bacterium]
MRARQPAYAALLACVIGAAIAGCSASVCAGSGCGIDSKKAANTVKTLVVNATGATLRSVSCPKSIPFKKGASFTCTATGADGTTAPVLVTQTDGKGNVHISAPTLLHTGTAAKLIAKGLSSRLKFPVTVKCPDLVNVHRGTGLTCTATHAGQTRKVKVTVTDDTGSIDYRLQ